MPPKKKRPARKSKAPVRLPEPLPLDGVPPLTTFPGHEAVLQWKNDLQVALQGADVGAWDLAGRMALIVTSPCSWGFQALCSLGLELGMRVRSVSAEELLLLPPIGDWKESSPSLLLLEPEAWMALDYEEDTTTPEYARSVAVVQWIAKSLAEAPPSCGVVIAAVASSSTMCPMSLREEGLLDRFLELPSEPMESRGRQLIEEIGSELLGESITKHPARFAHEYLGQFSDVRRSELAALQIRRHVWHTGKRFEFRDLVRLGLDGFATRSERKIEQEFDHRSTAYHEAGHAVVAIIDSKGSNTPEIASIVPTHRYQGVVVDSANYHLSKGAGETYLSFRHEIRVLLAGRAAEELAMGAEHVTNGCASDLDRASGYTLAAFSFWGFLPDMDVASNTGTNLLVCVEEGDDRMHEAEVEHRYALGRAFLDKEYQQVLSILKKNRPMLDKVAEALMEHLTLDQEMLARIAAPQQAGLV